MIQTLTWKVEGREGVSLGSSDHVWDLIHDTLLGQILPTMLTVCKSCNHLYSCDPGKKVKKQINSINEDEMHMKEGEKQSNLVCTTWPIRRLLLIHWAAEKWGRCWHSNREKWEIQMRSPPPAASRKDKKLHKIIYMKVSNSVHDMYTIYKMT